MTDAIVHHAEHCDISTDRNHVSEESDNRYAFHSYELALIHSSLITGLEALLEVERVHEHAAVLPHVSEDMLARNTMPRHPTGDHCAAEFCQALRFVHRAIFVDGERRDGA